MTKIAVIYYSSTGYTHRIARGVAEGARSTGAEVRLCKVRELAPDEVIAAKPVRKEHLEASRNVPEVTLADLEWRTGSSLRFAEALAKLRDVRTTP